MLKGTQLLWQGPNISKQLKTCTSKPNRLQVQKNCENMPKSHTLHQQDVLRVSANLAAVFVQSLH